MARPEGVWRATVVMTTGTAVSRMTGLLRVVAMAYALGVTGTRLADTYNLANTLPNMIYELFLGGVFTSVFVPVFEDMRRRRPGGESALVSVSLVALAVASLLAVVAAPIAMRIYTFRVADAATRAAQLELATFLLRWFAPQIFFYGMGAIAGALLNTREPRRFGPPMFAPALNNLVAAGTLLVFARAFSRQGLDLSAGARLLLGAGTTAGVAAQALCLIPFLRGERLRFRPSLSDPAVRRVLRLSSFVIGYVVINQVGIWVVYALANGRSGGVTAYQIAFMFFQLPHGLFAVSIVSALLPDLSDAASTGDWTRFRSDFATGVAGVAYLLVPAAIGYLLLAGPVTRLFVAHGAAGAADAAAVESVLRAFAVGLPFFSVFQLLLRHYYALQDTRTPMLLNAVGVAINVAVDLPLFALFGVAGLALGHSLAYAAGSILLLAALRRRIGGLGLAHLLPRLARIVVGAAVMGGAVAVCLRLVDGPDPLTLCVSIVVGFGTYLVVSRALALPEPALLTQALTQGVRGQGVRGRSEPPGERIPRPDETKPNPSSPDNSGVPNSTPPES